MSQSPNCKTHNHECQCSGSVACQSMDEMDFEKGIWSAAQYGEIERLRKLIDSGKFEVDQRDSAGYTALHYAARNGHLDVCDYLVQKGANINATTKCGLATALHRACSAGKTQIVDFLLYKKANVNLRDVDGKTVLHRASENNHKTICKLLLTHFPHLKDVADNKGNTPQNVS